MRLSDIFDSDELDAFSVELAGRRPAGAYEPGRWMVSPLNRDYGTARGHFPGTVKLRDISLRTIEQMPGMILSADDRRRLLVGLLEAGLPSVILTTFRRGHTVEALGDEIRVAREVAPHAELMLGNAVKAEEMKWAAELGVDAVQIWSATYLGRAMPVSSGAVYHRVWQQRDWHDLNFPNDVEDHLARTRRLIRAGREAHLRVSTMLNLLHYATEDYIEAYCRAAEQEGATEVVLTDSAGGVGPEAMARAVEIARASAPNCEIGVHAHNIFDLAVAVSLAAARAGATVVEVAVNGYEVGPAGSQATVAAMATSLEALYGVNTGIDLSRMLPLARLGESLTGYDIPWNEPIVGSAIFESAGADEYEMEANFDRLIHAAIEPSLVGGTRIRRVGLTTGPLGMWDILREIGVEVRKDQVETILADCLQLTEQTGQPVTEDDIRLIAARLIGATL